MSRFTRIAWHAFMVFVLFAAAGCSSGGGGGGTPTVPGSPITIGGYVLKGAVSGATVNVHAITATGAVGAVIAGPFTTDATGGWTGEAPSGTTGAHAVTATGGTYTDEATGGTVNVTSTMNGIIMMGQTNVGNVTPITHSLLINAEYRIQLGASKSAAFSGAIGDMSAALGFDPTTTAPPPADMAPRVVSSSNNAIYDALLAGFAELLDNNPILTPAFDNAETWAIVKAVAADISDGKLDGIDILGNGILVDPDGGGPGGFLPFPALDADDISNLVDAATAWAAVNAPGITIPLIDLSVFGNPTVTPGGAWDVTGSLAVTGSDAPLLADGNGLFTPTSVVVEEPMVPVGGFTFFRGSGMNEFIGLGFDTLQGLEVIIVSAQVPEHYWTTTGVPPVAEATVTNPSTDTWVVTFETVPMAISTISTETVIILDGQLTVSK